MGKTQVLVASINDHHRTRLTHTLEVTQIARTIARRLRLNEDLTESIALSHDLGHPPFGHAGEEALDECLREFGGFDHNLQGLRQVDEREDRYPEYPGLNLSFEVREAFVQHAKRKDHPVTLPFRDVGAPLLEAQVVDMADSLAYDVHDIDDALGIGLLQLGDLESVEMWRVAADRSRSRNPDIRGDRFRTAVLRELINWQIADLLGETERNLKRCAITQLENVRGASAPIVNFSEEVQQGKAALEAFLLARVYRHHRVLRMATKGQRFLRALFAEFVRYPELLPARHLRRWTAAPNEIRQGVASTVSAAGSGSEQIAGIVGDYLAGMTDRFAQQEYERLFQPASQ